jgi:hypothetical protein
VHSLSAWHLEADLSQSRSYVDGVGIGIGVGVGFGNGVGVGIDIGVGVGFGNGVGTGVFTATGVGVAVGAVAGEALACEFVTYNVTVCPCANIWPSLGLTCVTVLGALFKS